MVLSLAWVSGGCAGGEGVEETAEPSFSADPVMVAERWVSAADTAWNLDTPAVWTGEDGSVVLTTGKASHTLHVFDAATGEAQPAVGSPGEEPGQFRRPNGIAVLDDLVFVVERDNGRVQVLRMPGGEPVATFGESELEYPYGIAIVGDLPEPTIWVTDDYEVPAGAEPDVSRRIHRFDLELDGAQLTVRDHVALGGAAPAGTLSVVETIWADPAAELLLVADEAQKSYLGFDYHGAPTGAVLGLGRIAGDPEGLALVSCPAGSGYWIATDQRDAVSLFHVFGRRDFSFLGTFRGAVTANTDGVVFASGTVAGFGGPAFFAVHDDQAVAAFAWNDVAQALGLEEGCGMN